MPKEKGMCVLDTDASVVAISGILHQEQERNGRTVLRPIAYGSKVMSDTEMKYGAPKEEMFAVDRSSLMWSRLIPSPWHVYKQDLMKLNFQTVRYVADAIRMLNGARLSVNGLYSIAGVDWLIAAGINFSSTTALRFADLEGLPSNNTMGPVNATPLQDVKLNHGQEN